MYQKMVIVGNLGSDPEMRYMPDGTAVTNFSVAVNRRWTGNDGTPNEETTWFRISAWRKQAENCNQYLSRGNQVMVEGRLTPDKTTGGPRTFERRDGSVGASYELHALNVTFLGNRNDNNGSANGNPHAEYAGNAAVQEEDEIPF